jgi:L-asparaginase
VHVGYLTQQIRELTEMSRPEMPDFHIIEYDPLLDSSCMGPNEWVKVANHIEKYYYEYDGFVVIMGTDTMVMLSKN